jgi:hypothetical protein
VGIIFFSCIRDSKELQKRTPYSRTLKKDTTDLIVYKVKDEFFQPDSLNVKIKKVIWKKIAAKEYHLNIKADCSEKGTKYYKDYYLIFSIYPLDNELYLLPRERQKYKFESFSIKAKLTNENGIEFKRNVKTNVRLARAITISIIEYESKQKSSEIVLKNVTLE